MASAARKIFKSEEFELLNGKKVTARPLPITKLKKANSILRSLGDTEVPADATPQERQDLEEEDYLNKLLLIVDNSLELPLDEGEESGDVLDLDTIHEIVYVLTGVKLNDENLLKMAAELTQNQD